MPNNIANGGYQNADVSAYGSIGNMIGRIYNDISGTSANNQFNADQAGVNRAWSSAEAQKNRDWETQMSNTAFQRQVADMKAAGINPAAAALGSGASTPSGGIPNSSPAHSAAPGNGGFLAPISRIAGAVLGKVASAKIMAKASSARDAANAAKVVTQETARTERAMALQGKREADYNKYHYTKAERSKLEGMRRADLQEMADLVGIARAPWVD